VLYNDSTTDPHGIAYTPLDSSCFRRQNALKTDAKVCSNQRTTAIDLYIITKREYWFLSEIIKAGVQQERRWGIYREVLGLTVSAWNVSWRITAMCCCRAHAVTSSAAAAAGAMRRASRYTAIRIRRLSIYIQPTSAPCRRLQLSLNYFDLIWPVSLRAANLRQFFSSQMSE